jgi:hypothetical protein
MGYFIPVDRAENLIPGDINRDGNFNPGGDSARVEIFSM